MKRFAPKIFSKLVLGGLIMLLQFGWLCYMVYFVTEQNRIANLIIRGVSIILAIYVANKDMRPYTKLSWIFLILSLPFVGILGYFMFGRRALTRKNRRIMQKVMERMQSLRPREDKYCNEIKEKDFHVFRQTEYLSECAGYPVAKAGETKYFACGEEMMDSFLDDLRSAEKFIFMEYFILAPGVMLDSILAVLEEKAAQGVDVRLIYDDFGSISTLPSKFDKKMQSKGVKCVRFNPFRPFLSIIMNNRDHRKICVVDGKVAYTGGINLADEYINKKERFGYWKDSAIRITGEGVWSFTTIFLEMWSYITRSDEDYEKFKVVPTQDISNGYVQPYADSPLDKEDVGEMVYMNMIQTAKKYVYIFTPYLILGPEMIHALVGAAKRGVDVRIVTPAIPDKPTIFLLTKANYRPLVKGGVRIYQYTPGFLHSKSFVVDDEVAVVGSINLDFRSLYLHFECALFMYMTSAIASLKEDAIRTFEVSHEVTVEECEDKNFFVKLIQSILQLMAPLL